jgi:holo-[acyl-carrier protein] synthase
MDESAASAPEASLAVGFDLCDTKRVRLALTRHPRLAERLFCAGELAYANSMADPWPHLAARFAAKEAAMKVLGKALGKVGFLEIEVAREPSGKPYLVLRGKAAEVAREAGLEDMACSLSHTAELAAAVVVARRKSKGGQA